MKSLHAGSLCAAALVAGILVGRFTAPELAPGPGIDRPETPQAPDIVTPSKVVVRQGACPREAELEEENARLRSQLQASERYMGDIADQIDGVAARWNDNVPPALGPQGFEAQVRKALQECGPDADLVGVDCDEPPCLAVFRAENDVLSQQLIGSCPAWKDHFGTSVSSYSTNVDCGDGTTERINVAGPSITWDYVEEPQTEDPWNGSKRLSARTETWIANWECLGN